MKTHPEWATQYKKPGTELRFIRGRYYLYEVHSRWNPNKGRAQKITGQMLGRITQEHGFIESKKRLQQKLLLQMQIKEYGASFLITTLFEDSIKPLRKLFPNDWENLVGSAFCRLLYQSPLKNMDFYFSRSFLSEQYMQANLTAKHISTWLKAIGNQRDKIIQFFKTFIRSGEHLLMDVTPFHSKSSYLLLAKHGYNSQRNFDPQVNLMMMFSTKLTLPVYYRLLPGNIRDVKAFRHSLQESGIDDAVLVVDKGFYSETNIEELEKTELQYILPLRRNSVNVNYAPLEQSRKTGLKGYFKHNNRYIWYYHYPYQNKTIYIFLNELSKQQEEQDYLNRIETHPEEYSFVEFQKKNAQFGTLALISNIKNKVPKDIYAIYKSRMAIETMANVLKNILDADRHYMRDEETLEGWMFINHLALLWYYRLYQLIKQKNLLPKFSPQDLLLHLSEIRKIKIDQNWYLAEITSSTLKLLNQLDLHIT
jgi:transposase